MVDAANELYLGFDPGGDSKFGVALQRGAFMKSHTVASVDEAMSWAVGECDGGSPKAAGIDTLLHWATGKSGLRPCDSRLRKKYSAVQNSVMAPNSLYGAMAIGGMALALRLRQQWPSILLNETHPKVLLHELKMPYRPDNQASIRATVSWLKSEHHFVECSIEGEHQLDAAISAWTTQRGLVESWLDIIGTREKLLFPAGDVSYLWPNESSPRTASSL